MLRISFLQLLFVTLLVLSAVFAADAVEPETSQRESLQDALADINAASFHDALHVLSTKFRHGIFPTDLHAAEALQNEEPTIASLVRLAKRQSNGTASSEPATTPAPAVTTPSTEPVIDPSSDPTVTSAPETSVPDSSSSSTEPTTSAEPTPSADPTVTSSNPTSSSGSVSVPGETTGTVTTQTTGVPTTASPVSSTTRTAQTSTTGAPSTLSTTTSTSSSSSTSTTTRRSTTSAQTTEHTSLTTSTFKSTTTMPDGSLSTITSITVITPEATGKGGSPTAAAKPGLQTGAAAVPTGMTREIVAMVGGAVVVAMAL
jgi:hypothetical protein